LHKKQAVLFYPLSSFLALGFVVIYLSQDIFNNFVGLEIVGLSAVALSALQKSFKSIHSALVYLFATLVASGFYLLGVAIIYAKYSLLDIASLQQVVQNDVGTLVAFGSMVIAFLIKTALFPFSFWLPKAHANALSPVSALLSALVIKTTFYLLYLYSSTLFSFAINIHTLLGILGIIAIFYGGMKAFLSTNLKILIAYSTISQVGYLMVVFSLGHPYAFYGMVFVLLSHAFAKAGLFLAAGVIVHKAKSKSIEMLQGYASITPIAVFAIGLSSVSLIGLPPSLGFVSKWYYLQSTFESSSWIFFGAILVGGILSALYLFKILILFLDKPLEATQTAQSSKEKLSLSVLQWSAFSLSFFSVFLGLFSNVLIGFLG
jgi:formate hydrogenlyase subunit 3/multisubunit Na+/H+ antiporter MnhD subunit